MPRYSVPRRGEVWVRRRHLGDPDHRADRAAPAAGSGREACRRQAIARRPAGGTRRCDRPVTPNRTYQVIQR